MNPPDAGQKPPGTSNGPVLIDRATAEAFAAATRYVGTIVRGRDASGNGRGTGLNPGVYAYIPSGGMVTAASGAVLGTGTVTLCSRSAANLTANGETGVTVYNAGGHVDGPVYVKLGWAEGAWSLDVVLC